MTDKIVYVVTEGGDLDYTINGVFDNEDDAYLFAGEFGDRMIECQLNPLMRQLRDGCNMVYFIRMEYDGTTSEIEATSSLDGLKDYFGQFNDQGERIHLDPRKSGNLGQMRAYILARDEKHAVKIANERRVQAIAENRWPGQGKHFKAEG